MGFQKITLGVIHSFRLDYGLISLTPKNLQNSSSRGGKGAPIYMAENRLSKTAKSAMAKGCGTNPTTV